MTKTWMTPRQVFDTIFPVDNAKYNCYKVLYPGQRSMFRSIQFLTIFLNLGYRLGLKKKDKLIFDLFW